MIMTTFLFINLRNYFLKLLGSIKNKNISRRFSILANPVAMLAVVCTADTFYNFGAEKPLERYASLGGESLTKRYGDSMWKKLKAIVVLKSKNLHQPCK